MVACTFSGGGTSTAPINLRVYDGDGNELFNDASSLLDSFAWGSAPIVFNNGTVLAVDDNYIAIFKAGATNNILGKQRLVNAAGKRLGGIPISPVMVNDHIVLLATICKANETACPVSTWDISGTPTLLDYAFVTATVKGSTVAFETANTPTVDQQNSRVYLVMSGVCPPKQGGCAQAGYGRLQALDIDVTGHITISAWHYGDGDNLASDAESSPLLIKNNSNQNQIFFDAHDSINSVGYFIGVTDGGGITPSAVWQQPFNKSRFVAAAARDLRSDLQDGSGTFWIFPTDTSITNQNCTTLTPGDTTTPYFNCLIRLRASDGKIVQGDGKNNQPWVDLTPMVSGDPVNLHYAPSSTINVSKSSSGDVALTLGAFNGFGSRRPVYVTSIDVTPPQGQLLWKVAIAANPSIDWAAGQFPIAVSPTKTSASGSPVYRTVFSTFNSGPFFIGPNTPVF